MLKRQVIHGAIYGAADGLGPNVGWDSLQAWLVQYLLTLHGGQGWLVILYGYHLGSAIDLTMLRSFS